MTQDEFDELLSTLEDSCVFGKTPAQREKAIKAAEEYWEAYKDSHPLIRSNAIHAKRFKGPAFEIPGVWNFLKKFIYCPLQIVATAIEDGFILDGVDWEKPITVKYKDIPKILERLLCQKEKQ